MAIRIIRSPEQIAWDLEHALGPAVKIDRFYDRGARVWTAYPADAKGNQVGDCMHEHRKEWLSVNLADYPVWDI
jgi:hypothetical protein